MKQRVDTLVSSFIDYKGQEHKFVVAAVSEVLPKTYGEAHPDEKNLCEEEMNTKVSYEVVEYNEWDSEYGDSLVKTLRLGVSICNPIDEFNERAGMEKAIHRAKNCKHNALYATDKGYISTRVVRAMLEQEAHYVKTNPGKYIKGYDEAKAKYEFEVSNKNAYDSLTDDEKLLAMTIKDFDLNKLKKFKQLAKYAE